MEVDSGRLRRRRPLFLHRPLVVAIAAFSIGCVLACFPPRARTAERTRTVTDMAGRRVQVPAQVERIACLPGPSYELVFMLGGKDQIAVVREDHKQYPLAVLTNPDLRDYSSSITQVGPRTRINVEEFLQAELDAVIYYTLPSAVEMLEEAGIPVFCTWATESPHSLKELMRQEKRLVTSLAVMLGRGAPDEARRWCRYLEQTVRFIRSRTKGLERAERPRVYIGNSWGRNPLATWGGDGHEYTVRLCGGRYVASGIRAAKFPEVSLEQVMAWAPDVIVIDSHGGSPDKVVDSIRGNPDWASIPAVRRGEVHRMPSGVFHLNKGSSKPLYFLWLAKLLHPELFDDIDMVSVICEYFASFYDAPIPREIARHALKGWGHGELEASSGK